MNAHKVTRALVVASTGICWSWLSCSCSGGSGSGSSSGATGATTTVADAAPSPFSVVLEAKSRLVLSALSGGVAVTEDGKKQWAIGLDGGELSPAAMPSGLPEGDGHVLRFGGKAPSSVWMTYEIPGEDKKGAKHPLFRLDSRKGEWKQYADDWRPHLSVWSKGRIVAASTSSGKLKIKVMEPYAKEAPPDLPNPKLEDASCQKGLRVEAFSALPSGTMVMAGNCKPEGASAKRYVVLQWHTIEEAAAVPGSARPGAAKPKTPAAMNASAAASTSATATAAPSASASTSASAPLAAAPSASASAPQAPTSASASASAAPAQDPGKEADSEASFQPPGKVFVAPGVDVNLVHLSLCVAGEDQVWALAEEEKSHKPHLFHFDASKIEEVALPALEGAARALSMGKDGTLWLVTDRAILKRGADAAWQSVPPPNAAFPEPEPAWELFDVVASGDSDVWISAKHTSKTASRHVLLRLRAPKSVVQWP